MPTSRSARKPRNSRTSRSYSLRSRASRSPQSLSPFPIRVKIEDSLQNREHLILTVEENEILEEEPSTGDGLKLELETKEDLKTLSIETDDLTPKDQQLLSQSLGTAHDLQQDTKIPISVDEDKIVLEAYSTFLGTHSWVLSTLNSLERKLDNIHMRYVSARVAGEAYDVVGQEQQLERFRTKAWSHMETIRDELQALITVIGQGESFSKRFFEEIRATLYTIFQTACEILDKRLYLRTDDVYVLMNLKFKGYHDVLCWRDLFKMLRETLYIIEYITLHEWHPEPGYLDKASTYRVEVPLKLRVYYAQDSIVLLSKEIISYWKTLPTRPDHQDFG